MPRARIIAAVGLLWLAGPVGAESVLDVSKEWAAHQSTAALVEQEKKAAELKASTAAAPGPACACESMTVQERLDESTYAFTGFVMEASAAKKGKRTLMFDVDEIFKGDPNPEMKVNFDVTDDACDLPFKEGQKYLVYAKWEWANVFTTACMGTKRIDNFPRELGASQAMKERLYIHLRNACMGRLDTSCCLSSLKAMSSGFYVPEPEDGCPAGTIPDRLHCAGSYTWCVAPTDKTHQ